MNMTPLQELAAYVAAGRESGPEELLRLARLAISAVIAQVDAHPELEHGVKWKLVEAHPVDGAPGLRPLCRLLGHAEELLVEELREASRLAQADALALHQPPPLSMRGQEVQRG